MGLFGKDVHHHHRSETHSTQLVPYEKTVHEHRAPTDESIKIYEEMRHKVQKEIIGEVKLEVAGIEVAGVAFMEEGISQTVKWMFLVKINGKEHKIEIKYDPWETREMMKRKNIFPKEVVNNLVEKLGAYIAKVILIDPQVGKIFNKEILKR